MRMIRLLIVDDEPAMRIGLKETIPWTEHGITVAGEADNGLTALQKAIQLEPDVVLCDIRMPVKDGITFVSELVQLMPDIHVIFITGYDDRKYLMEAIRNRVCDYLLKPVTQEQVLQAVLRVREDLERKSREEKKIQSIGFWALENRNVLIHNFWNRLLNETMTEDQIRRGLESLDLQLPGPYYTLLAICCEPGAWLQTVQRCPAVFSEWHPAVIPEKSQYLVTVLLSSPNPVAADDIRSRLPEAGGCHCSFLSKSIKQTHLIREQNRLCGEYVKRSLYYADGTVTETGAASFPEFHQNTAEEIERDMFQALSSGYLHKGVDLMETWWDRMIGMRPENRTLIQKINQILFRASMICHLDPPEDLAEYFCRMNDLRKAYFHTISQIMNTGQRYEDIPVRRALQYIGTHFAEDLSLEYVAAELCISSSYLSKMLNEKTEHGFYGWLHYYRILNAKELLATTDLKHYEIAEKVGYNSYKKFAEHFQHETHVSAKEYRKQMENSGNAQAEGPEVSP